MGNRSGQIDLVVFDNLYSSVLFPPTSRASIFPPRASNAVFEIKPTFSTQWIPPSHGPKPRPYGALSRTSVPIIGGGRKTRRHPPFENPRRHFRRRALSGKPSNFAYNLRPAAFSNSLWAGTPRPRLLPGTRRLRPHQAVTRVSPPGRCPSLFRPPPGSTASAAYGHRPPPPISSSTDAPSLGRQKP